MSNGNRFKGRGRHDWTDDAARPYTTAGASGGNTPAAVLHSHDTDLDHAETAAPLSADLLSALLQHTDCSFLVIDEQLRVQSWQGPLFTGLAVGHDEAAGLQMMIRRLGDPNLRTDVQAAFAGQPVPARRLVADTTTRLERRVSLAGTEPRVALISYHEEPAENFRQVLFEGEKLVLHGVTQRQPLQAVFDTLVNFIERHTHAGVAAALCVLSEDGRHLRHAAGSGLPREMVDASERWAIGARAGSCGTAAYRRARVIVSDIAADPLWAEYRDLALKNGLRACWSDPILSSSGKLLGVFAVYCDRPMTPAQRDLALTEMATRGAALAIEQTDNETQRRRQSLLLANVAEACIACDATGRITYWNAHAEALFGYDAEAARQLRIATLLDVDALRTRLAGQHGAWSGELDVMPRSGAALRVAARVSALVDDAGNPAGYVGAFQAAHAGTEASNAALEQGRRQQAMAQLGSLALGEENLQTLLDETVGAVAATLDVPLCMILERDPDGATLRLRAGVGWPADQVGSVRVSAGFGSQAGYTLSCKAPVVVTDLRTEVRFSGSALLRDHGVVSGMSVPIMGPGATPFGVLSVHCTLTREFTERDVNFLQSVANILAAAIRRAAVEASLRESEQRFRHLANAIPKIVWAADARGIPDYFNDRWYVSSGLPADHQGTSAWDTVLHPEDAIAWQKTWAECVAVGRPFELEYRFFDATTKDYRWHLGRAVPIRDARGTLYRWYGSSTDIDEQKRTQLQLRAQAHTLEMVNWVNSILASQLDLELLAQTVIDVGTNLIGARFGAFFYGGDGLESGYFRLYACSGLDHDALTHCPVLRLSDMFGMDLHGKNVVRCADITRDPDYRRHTPFDGLVPADAPVHSYCAATVVSRSGEVLGSLLFGHPEADVFDAGDEALIKGLATQAALAVDNARMYRALWESEDHARRQLEQINAIYATAPIGLCFLDAELRFKSMNEHLANMAHAATVRDVDGQTLAEVLGEAAAAIQPLCETTLAQRRPVLDQEVFCRVGGTLEPCHWLCSCYPIRGGADEILGINMVVQDITARKQSETELTRLAEIVASSYDAIIAETLDGTISSWNGGAERLYGYRADEIVGLPIDTIIPEGRRDSSARFLLALQSGERMRVEEAERICKDGRRVFVSMTISPLRNASGEMIGVSSIERDITLQKQAEAAIRGSESHMRFILSASRVGTWDWNIATGAVQWSENMEQLHGRAPGSFDGTFDSALADVHPDDRERMRAAVASAMEGSGDYHIEYRVKTSDGAIRWVEGKGQVIRDASEVPIHMAGICMDITERKEAEDALRVSESMLRNKAEELAVAHRQKDEFLAMLAHELRNPLAPISNSVQLLKMNYGQSQPDYVPWAIDVIDRQVGQIARLVDDLLDVARITRGRIELKKELVDAADIMRQAVENVIPLMTTKQHLLDVRYPREPVIIHVDPIRMVQSISNLLHNAVKFTPEGGKILFSASHDGVDLTLRVIDNGIGISPDVVPQVFDLFVQADRSLDRRQGGLGLGLTLVKRLVEMHEGHVAVVSAGMGRGSEFTVRLPLAPGACQPSTHETDLFAPSVDPAAHGMRILVVDDNAESAESLAILLRSVGHQVDTAYNGEAALIATHKDKPDVVFLDIGLPLMDGYEVARRLRDMYGQSLLLIALSGYAPNPENDRLRQANFDHYLLKPVSFDQLQSLLADRAPDQSLSQ